MRSITFGHHFAAQNMASLAAPIRKLTIRPAYQVLGWDDRQKAEWALAVATRDVPALEARFVSACAALGAANRMGAMKRYWQSKAFRSINQARAQLRAARRALEAAQAAMMAMRWPPDPVPRPAAPGILGGAPGVWAPGAPNPDHQG